MAITFVVSFNRAEYKHYLKMENKKCFSVNLI